MGDAANNMFRTGEVLENKWVVLEFLGKGGMGEVYRVHQVNLNRDEAVKIISPRFLAEIADNEYEAETCLERFHREVQVMAQVRHPYVLQIFDCGSLSINQGATEVRVEYIAMEYVPGGTLRSTMSAEGFHPDEGRMREWLATYFLPLLGGVRALHQLGIVHRDLKPENVLLDGNIPKITDFGLARSHRSKPVTQSMDMRGTPPYMSPEHLLDLKRTDRRTDVYALGKILYEAASGKISSDEIPFKQASLKGPETFFYRRLDSVIRAATAEERNQRTPSVELLEQAIEEILAGGKKAILPNSPSGVVSAGPWKKRIEAALLVILVSAATALGVMTFHKRGYKAPRSSVQTMLPSPGAREKQSGASPASLLHGKDEDLLHLIPGGVITLPKGFGPNGGRTFKVDSFYLDETMVTNQQYVHFLNRSLSRIKVENGLVQAHDGHVWLLLGEVIKGYEPIVFSEGKFRLADAAHAACPVLRVTAFGARAYARFYGERLITDVEWLYATSEGGRKPVKAGQSALPAPAGEQKNQTDMHAMMHGYDRQQKKTAPVPDKTLLPVPLPVIMSKPNGFGIRGLNGSMGEWGFRRKEVSAPGGNNEQVQYLVLGGILSRLESGNSVASALSSVERYPWEAFSDVGFRCAKSLKVMKRG